MKNFLTLFFAVIAMVAVTNAQDISSSIAPLYDGPNWGTISDTGITCSGGPLVNIIRDDGTYENGYRSVSTGDSTTMVQKMVMPSAGFVLQNMCVTWTSLSPGGNITFDLIIYDTTGAGGSPGNVVYRVNNVVANATGIFPAHTRYTYPINFATTQRAYYVGVRWNNNPILPQFFSADENGPVSTMGPGYQRLTTTYPPVFTDVTLAFPLWKSWGVRLEGAAGSTQNYALNLPTPGVNTNYVGIPHQAGMIGFTNFTIEAWVKPGGVTTAATVLNKGALSFDYQLGISATTMIPFVRLQGVVATATAFVVTPLIWTHIAASFDGTNVRFYKDGVLVSTVPLAGTPGSSANEMRIGRGNADAGNGNIEELRLWTVARTQGAIDSNKCRKYPSQFTNSTGLRGLWHLDNNLIDSVSGFNGTGFGTISFDTVSFPIPGVSCILVGIEPVGNIIPNTYSLNQNYPNPFNPSTSIKFSIPKGGFVELKIYDILGREVSSLVNDPYEAGTYEVTFEASKLASGVYFYTLVSGDFKETKKMLLIK